MFYEQPLFNVFDSYLVSVTRQAKCYGWCLLLATMTLDLGTLMQTLHEAKKQQPADFMPLFDQYKNAILSTGWSVMFFLFMVVILVDFGFVAWSTATCSSRWRNW